MKIYNIFEEKSAEIAILLRDIGICEMVKFKIALKHKISQIFKGPFKLFFQPIKIKNWHSLKEITAWKLEKKCGKFNGVVI